MSRLFTDNEGKWDWKKIGYRARAAFAVTLSLAILVGGGLFAYQKLSAIYMEWRTADDYIGTGKDDVRVAIPAGVSLTDIGGILIDARVVKSMKAFRAAVNAEPKAQSIQAGNFALKTEIPAKLAVKMLLDPKSRVINRVTIIEGLRLERQWAAISKSTGIPVANLQAAAAKPDQLGLPKWAAGKPEGFMFPDTYEIADKPTAQEVLAKQVKHFNVVAESLNFEGKASDLKLTPYQALTVASLVQAETGSSTYMPQVARVVYNRLAKKMPLQFDSTVHYVVNKYDTVLTTPEQRKVDSPYNTYLAKNAGLLPPGPIDSPGKAAMQAALNPVAGDWLYFVTVNLDTGETLFAKTYEEHLANDAKRQAWCRANPGKGC